MAAIRFCLDYETKIMPLFNQIITFNIIILINVKCVNYRE